MYSEYNTRPISSYPVTTRTRKCSGSFLASNRGSAQRTGWLRRISRRHPVVRCNRCRTPEKIQCGQRTAGSKELPRERRKLRIILDNVILFGLCSLIGRSEAGTEARSETSTEGYQRIIGLINYFGRMIPNYAAKTRCINELRQNDTPFMWTDRCQRVKY